MWKWKMKIYFFSIVQKKFFVFVFDADVTYKVWFPDIESSLCLICKKQTQGYGHNLFVF